MKSKKKITVFLAVWVMLQIITIAVVAVFFIVSNPNWSEMKRCVSWNYSCIENCEHANLCDIEMDCCTSRELVLWSKIKFYAGVTGLGLNIFLALIVMQHILSSQNKSTEIKREKFVLTTIIDLVFSSERAMPARYTSNGDRTMSFCVEIEELTADDESALASFPWSAINGYYTKLSQEQQDLVSFHVVLKQSEDIMIAAFANQVRFDSEVDAEELTAAIIEENLDILEENEVEVTDAFRAAIYSEPIQAFYQECYDYAKQRAVSHE